MGAFFTWRSARKTGTRTYWIRALRWSWMDSPEVAASLFYQWKLHVLAIVRPITAAISQYQVQPRKVFLKLSKAYKPYGDLTKLKVSTE